MHGMHGKGGLAAALLAKSKSKDEGKVGKGLLLLEKEDEETEDDSEESNAEGELAAGEELLEAIEAKDAKAIVAAVKALIEMC